MKRLYLYYSIILGRYAEGFFENGKLCSDVCNFSSERHKNKINGKVVKMEHVTPKPKDLIERIILASSNKGDVVMDPFVGMDTTAIVSKKLGRYNDY